ncbi:MAG TPA: ROK family protein [Pyrinomonadaceae bacterium]|nr:ROK family protein [Pyrinomonadaceae bacterium]
MSAGENSDRICIGIEVGKTALSAARVDANGNVTDRETAEVSFSETSTSQLIYFISSLRSSLGDFDRVGVAVPGLVAPDKKKVAFSSNIPEHSGLDLGGEIEAAVGVPVYIENDANAAAFGEFKLGAGQGAANMFYATLGIGVGGALIINGEIWRGAAGYAGEFGFVPINSEGTRLEDVASSANIIRRTRSRFHQDSTSSLVELDENTLTIADIVAAATAGDDFAQLMLERTGTYVGTGIASVINILNIERIVVGGEIMQAGELIMNPIIDRARELSFAPSFASASIVHGDLAGFAAATGVALLACQNS